MKYFLLLFIFLGHGAEAQDVGLGNDEVRSLRDRLRSPRADASLLRLYGTHRALAALALTEDPHPIDTIRSEGLLQGDPKKTATQDALRDMGKMYALALVYRVGGDSAYFRTLQKFLDAWASTDKPRGDPIDDTNLDPVIEAYDMVKTGLPAAERKVVRDWLSLTAAWEQTAIYNKPGRATSYNNWHSHRL